MTKARLWCLLLMTYVFSSPSFAQNYPNRIIKLVVPYPAGAGSDTIGRAFAARLGQKLGQTVLVENTAGAGGSLGAASVSAATPDGYTLLLGNTGPNAIAPSIVKSVRYDVSTGFTPISVVGSAALFVLVDASSPYTSLADLVRDAKADPGKHNFASSGVGGLSHLFGELMSGVTGAKFTHVPYRGGAAALTAVLTKDVTFHTPSAIDGVAQVQSGKMRALAVTSSKRWPSVPDVPTVAEAGFPGLTTDFWYGLFAPPGLPAPVLDILSQATREMLNEAETRKRFEEMGTIASPTTPAEFAKIVENDAKRYAAVAVEAGLKPE